MRMKFITLQECMHLIKKEKLFNYNWFDDHRLKSNEVCIRKTNTKYVVFVTSERCSPLEDSVEEFIEESKALENYLFRLRALKNLFSK